MLLDKLIRFLYDRQHTKFMADPLLVAESRC